MRLSVVVPAKARDDMQGTSVYRGKLKIGVARRLAQEANRHHNPSIV
jgi:hypothetical protein